ncbi:MAG TPA: prolyl oligopeptidase family serine peptidase [Allosphingosinicella sp.]|nr:prolyl oligopeptidase family serine peptidase [Allosphingosinicella sp.]
MIARQAVRGAFELVRAMWVMLALFGVVEGTPALGQPARDSASSGARPLGIDDVLNTERLDRAALSPDGEWVAAVVQRAARPGEVYGRIAYEVDPGRNDIWLISTRTGARRNITRGAGRAAGYWCATWSPDGRRLALLSTRPEGREPRGGDNVRLYVWERSSGAMTRMSDEAIMTQTRYGSGLNKLDLRGGADRGTVAHACNSNQENAPFLWLDDHRLLAVMLPAGETSGLIDQYGRPFRAEARDAARLRSGVVPTVSAIGSGGAAAPARHDDSRAILRIVDTRTRAASSIATVPAYPFRGSLTISVSPDGKRLALLVTVGALPPQAGRRFPNVSNDAWAVERRLGFVDLEPRKEVRWQSMPAAGRYPLELYGWSPDSRRIALRARADPFATATPLFIAEADSGAVAPVGPPSVGDAAAGANRSRPSSVLWASARRLVGRSSRVDAGTPGSWWLLDPDGTALDLGRANAVAPDAFAVAGDGSAIALAGKSVLRLDAVAGRLVPVAQLSGEASFLPQQDLGKPTNSFVILMDNPAGVTGFTKMDALTYRTGPLTKVPDLDLLELDAAAGTLMYSQRDRGGVFLRRMTLSDHGIHELLALNGFMARIDWGTTRLIEYEGGAGEALKAAVILPPDYRPGRLYPTLVWVYGGNRVRSLEGEFWLDPFLPGLYNLRLYAARGYVVLIPSMPLPPPRDRADVYAQIPKGVMPAIDRLVALGIADPGRLGVFGQSLGGYSVYALVSQSDRFKAAVAMAGVTSLAAHFGQFDPTARGYAGIMHEKSDNWAELDQFGESKLPWEDPDDYSRNSPLTYVDRVRTPLLMIHGSADIRGAQTHAEQFFYSLYRQGKTAELLLYGGESHGLSQSPANVRDIFDRTIRWFDRYLKGPDAAE